MKRRILRMESCISKCLIGILIFAGAFNMMFMTPVSVCAGESGDSAAAAENAQVLIFEVSDPAPEPEVSETEPVPVVTDPAPDSEVSEPEPEPEVSETEPTTKVSDPAPESVVSEPEPAPEVSKTEPTTKVSDPAPVPEMPATEPVLKAAAASPSSMKAESDLPKNGIPVVIIYIDESEGNNTIDDMNTSPDHSVDCVGSIQIIVPEDFQYCDIDTPPQSLEAVLDHIHGRGNSTWTMEKKPYKLKLSSSANVLGLGENKHWVLMANAADPTVIKNRLCGWLGDELGFEYTPNGVPVDVVMIGMKDGEEVSRTNLGSYLLAEQIRVDKNRLNIHEPKKKDTDPKDITGGYLIQYGMQVPDDDPDNFYTDRGLDLANHTPTFDPEDEDYTNEQQKEYIRNYIQMIENAIYGADFRDENGIRYTDYMDMESAAKYWLVQEVSNNLDEYITGSTYFYKKADIFDESGELTELGKVYWGPLWDFDFAWRDGMADVTKTEGFRSAPFTWIAPMLYDDSETGFRRTVQALWPNVRDKVLSTIKDGGIIDQYYQEAAASYEKDYVIWKDAMPERYKGRDDYGKNISALKEWISARVAWMDGHMSGESADGAATLDNAICRLQYMVDDALLYQDYYQRNGSYSTEQIYNKYIDILEKEGFVFLGWKDQNGNIINGRSQIPEDLILTAYYLDPGEPEEPSDIIDPDEPEEPSGSDEKKPDPSENDSDNDAEPSPDPSENNSDKDAEPSPAHAETPSGKAAVLSVPAWNVEISAEETMDMLREALLSPDEQREAARGKKIRFTVAFHDGEDIVSAEDKAAVIKAIGSGTLVKWLDIAMYKQIEGSEKVKVEHAGRKVKLQITAPEDILSRAASGTAFEMICVADGQVIRIPAYYNPETNTIDFETDVFGVFALVCY